jgi:hypothetical protein
MPAFEVALTGIQFPRDFKILDGAGELHLTLSLFFGCDLTAWEAWLPIPKSQCGLSAHSPFWFPS